MSLRAAPAWTGSNSNSSPVLICPAISVPVTYQDGRKGTLNATVAVTRVDAPATKPEKTEATA